MSFTEEFKKKTNEELIDITLSFVSHSMQHKTAAIELARRAEVARSVDSKTQRSIKRMTFWILILTVQIFLISIIQVLKLLAG